MRAGLSAQKTFTHQNQTKRKLRSVGKINPKGVKAKKIFVFVNKKL